MKLHSGKCYKRSEHTSQCGAGAYAVLVLYTATHAVSSLHLASSGGSLGYRFSTQPPSDMAVRGHEVLQHITQSEGESTQHISESLLPTRLSFHLHFQGSVTAVLFVGYSLSSVFGIVINAVSVTLSGYVLVGCTISTLLSLLFPAMLVSVPHVVPIITFTQGLLHVISYQITIRILTRWIPDKENTFLSSLFFSGYVTGRMGVMFLSAPIAEKVHWSAPSIIFGSVSLCVIGLLGTQVSLTQ